MNNEDCKIYCKKCGKEFELGETKCPNCGYELTEDEKKLMLNKVLSFSKENPISSPKILLVFPIIIIIGLMITSIIELDFEKENVNDSNLNITNKSGEEYIVFFDEKMPTYEGVVSSKHIELIEDKADDNNKYKLFKYTDMHASKAYEYGDFLLKYGYNKTSSDDNEKLLKYSKECENGYVASILININNCTVKYQYIKEKIGRIYHYTNTRVEGNIIVGYLDIPRCFYNGSSFYNLISFHNDKREIEISKNEGNGTAEESIDFYIKNVFNDSRYKKEKIKDVALGDKKTFGLKVYDEYKEIYIYIVVYSNEGSVLEIKIQSDDENDIIFKYLSSYKF